MDNISFTYTGVAVAGINWPWAYKYQNYLPG